MTQYGPRVSRRDRLSSPEPPAIRVPKLATRRNERDQGEDGGNQQSASQNCQIEVIPGAGSANRAGPMGIRGDATIATTTAPMAPKIVTTPARIRDRMNRSDRVMPMALRVGFSAASSTTWRPISWDITTRVIKPASNAKERGQSPR